MSNPVIYAGTAGTAIPVAADVIVVFGGTADAQLIKVTDGVQGGTVGAKVTTDGLYVFQSNAGTVAGTVTVANPVGTVAVSNATFPVTQSTSPWVTAGTVSVSSLPGVAGTVSTANQGTVVGTVTMANATVAVTQSTNPWTVAGTVTTSPSGTAIVKEVRAATTTVVGVAASVAGVNVLAANTARIGAAVYNSSTSTLYLGLQGSAATTANVYTLQVQPNGYVEVPFQYTGIVSGAWAAANGSALVTELTV